MYRSQEGWIGSAVVHHVNCRWKSKSSRHCVHRQENNETHPDERQLLLVKESDKGKCCVHNGKHYGKQQIAQRGA